MPLLEAFFQKMFREIFGVLKPTGRLAREAQTGQGGGLLVSR